MRLVLDTNIIVSGFRSSRGASNALLQMIENKRIKPLCSTTLFLEYEAVLSRAETRAITGHGLDDVKAIMNALATLCEPVDISFTVRPMLPDADDEMVLETALNGLADAIVTHNARDFKPAPALGIEVVKPGVIVRRLSE